MHSDGGAAQELPRHVELGRVEAVEASRSVVA
jgi:hypothetical protein